jgi:alkylation response protein AidB-like acyl-CoA dehydrogenase
MPFTDLNFTDFIKNLEQTLKRQFHTDHNINELSATRGLPDEVLEGIMETVPLSVAIPEEYSGRGSEVKDILTMLSITSYESLPLALTFGINIGLFLGPVAKYGHSSIKQGIFDRFTRHQAMGGMMITEPNYGSDALNMQTTNKVTEQGYAVQGIKHWQGLTGMAEYWLIASRSESSKGQVSRDLDFFICDTKQQGQQIEVEEYFDALGLYMIPYGRNKVNVQIPEIYKLLPETTGIKMLLDILHRSRMQFPGMAMGFIRRMLDEATEHCKNRIVGGGNLLSMDHIAYQISRLQSAYTICSAMCCRSSAISSPSQNLATEGLEANSIKAVVTDLMQESSQILVQVSGASGYRISNVGGRGIMDSRPFQIFEGANEMLYTQVADIVTKLMKKQKELNLFDFLKGFKLTAESCQHFKNDLCLTISNNLTQRKMYDLGKVLSRVISAGYVLDIGTKGFRKDMIDNCITMVQQEVGTLMASFCFDNKVHVVEGYAENSSWLAFA